MFCLEVLKQEENITEIETEMVEEVVGTETVEEMVKETEGIGTMVVMKVVGTIETEMEMILETGMVEEMVVTETVEEMFWETVGIEAMVVVKVVGTTETEMEMMVETGMVEDMVNIKAVMMVSDNLEVTDGSGNIGNWNNGGGNRTGNNGGNWNGGDPGRSRCRNYGVQHFGGRGSGGGIASPSTGGTLWRGGRNAKGPDDFDIDDDEEANVDSSTRNDDIVSQNDEVFKCEKCEVEFYIDTDIEYHLAKDHCSVTRQSRNSNECERCGIEFDDGTNLRNHIQTDHCDKNRYELKLIECHHCGIKFSEKETVKRHLQINHSVTHGLKYGQCDNEFKDNDEDKTYM